MRARFPRKPRRTASHTPAYRTIASRTGNVITREVRRKRLDEYDPFMTLRGKDLDSYLKIADENVILPTSVSPNKSPSRWRKSPHTSRRLASLPTSSAGSSRTKIRANAQTAELVGRLHDQLAAAEEASLGASAPPVV